MARNIFPSSGIGRDGTVVQAGEMFIEEDAHVGQKVCCDFFVFAVAPPSTSAVTFSPVGVFAFPMNCRALSTV